MEHDLGVLMACVARCDSQLCADVALALRRAFSDGATRRAVERAAPERRRDEFLMNLDAHGHAVDVPDAWELDGLAHAEAGSSPWVRVDEGRVLVARWLCHVLGLRHATVHLLLDHPLLERHAIVQVRSLDKEEAPGCFDLPVAGHVGGLASPEAALATECREELGLEAGDLVCLRQLGAYEHALLPSPSGFRDVEYRTVYQARLTREGWLRASAADREVAAVALFSVRDLEALLGACPERVAPGLRATFARYGTGTAEACWGCPAVGE